MPSSHHQNCQNKLSKQTQTGTISSREFLLKTFQQIVDDLGVLKLKQIETLEFVVYKLEKEKTFRGENWLISKIESNLKIPISFGSSASKSKVSKFQTENI